MEHVLYQLEQQLRRQRAEAGDKRMDEIVKTVAAIQIEQASAQGAGTYKH